MGLKNALDFTTNQLPLGCEEKRKRLLKDALKNPRRRPRRNERRRPQAWLLPKRSVYVAAAAVSSGLVDVFTLTDEHRVTLKAFLHGKDVFSFLPSSVEQSGHSVANSSGRTAATG